MKNTFYRGKLLLSFHGGGGGATDPEKEIYSVVVMGKILIYKYIQ